MNCWSVLGIDSASDPKTIKRAYARLLKDAHPEERPEEFMLLRQAYETALNYVARQYSQRPVPNQHESELDSQGPVAQAEHEQIEPVQSSPQPSEEELEYRQFMQRLQDLADDLHHLLADPTKRNNPGHWETLLLAPELNSLDVRLAIGNSLLQAVLEMLEAKPKETLDPRILIRLDERFHWSTDQGVNWSVPAIQLHSLSLLIEAAKEAQSRARKPLGWRWLRRSMFGSAIPLSRLEYLFTQTMNVSMFMLCLKLLQYNVVVPIVEPIVSVLLLFFGYAVLAAHMKRLQDAAVSPYWIFILGFIFPPLHLIAFFRARPGPQLTENDPRNFYTDPYYTAVTRYFGKQHKQSTTEQIKQFYHALKPGLVILLGFLWIMIAGMSVSYSADLPMRTSNGDTIQIKVLNKNIHHPNIVFFHDDYDCFGLENIPFARSNGNAEIALSRKPTTTVMADWTANYFYGDGRTLTSCTAIRSFDTSQGNEFVLITENAGKRCDITIIRDPTSESSGFFKTARREEVSPLFFSDGPFCKADTAFQGSSLYETPRGTL